MLSHGRHVCRGALWNLECNRALVDGLVVRVNQLDQHFVRAGWQPLQDDRGAARIRPAPRCIVDGHVNVAHARRDGQSARTKHRCNAQVLRTVFQGAVSNNLKQFLHSIRAQLRPGFRTSNLACRMDRVT